MRVYRVKYNTDDVIEEYYKLPSEDVVRYTDIIGYQLIKNGNYTNGVSYYIDLDFNFNTTSNIHMNPHGFKLMNQLKYILRQEKLDKLLQE